MTWKSSIWHILDIETTGVDLDCKIVEIAVVTMQNGQVVEHWSTIVNPEVPIPNDATLVHGISDEIAAKYPTWAKVKPIVESKIMGATVFVGYNIFGFDEDRLARHGIELIAPVIDPFAIVRSPHAINEHAGPGSLWKSEPYPQSDPLEPPEPPSESRRPPGKYALVSVAERLRLNHLETGIPPEVHTATWDCVLAGRVLHAALHLCSEDAGECSRRLRTAHERASAKAKATRQWAYEQEVKRHDGAATRWRQMMLDRDRRIAELAVRSAGIATLPINFEVT